MGGVRFRFGFRGVELGGAYLRRSRAWGAYLRRREVGGAHLRRREPPEEGRLGERTSGGAHLRRSRAGEAPERSLPILPPPLSVCIPSLTAPSPPI